MRKLKEKNLPQALSAINKANVQSDTRLLEQLQRGTKLELSEPKISDSELEDIQKFAQSGINGLSNILMNADAERVEAALTLRSVAHSKASMNLKGRGATGHLLSSVQSIKDDVLSTITQNQQRKGIYAAGQGHHKGNPLGLLGKRAHASTSKVLKDAEDALVFKTS